MHKTFLKNTLFSGALAVGLMVNISANACDNIDYEAEATKIHTVFNMIPGDIEQYGMKFKNGSTKEEILAQLQEGYPKFAWVQAVDANQHVEFSVPLISHYFGIRPSAAAVELLALRLGQEPKGLTLFRGEGADVWTQKFDGELEAKKDYAGVSGANKEVDQAVQKARNLFSGDPELTSDQGELLTKVQEYFAANPGYIAWEVDWGSKHYTFYNHEGPGNWKKKVAGHILPNKDMSGVSGVSAEFQKLQAFGKKLF